ncbi:MAG: TfoX/Sxy family protein [Bacteroidetes bacterium]|nr:TfoX/Sxy family protein [Bacteroidota bacterium]
MAYNLQLADRVRAYLESFPKLTIEEKKMFRGLAFLINGKMCLNISGNNLMCRFDPDLTQTIVERKGFLPMVMRGKKYKGYGYVEPVGFQSEQDFQFWVTLCLDFNDRANSSKKRVRK